MAHSTGKTARILILSIILAMLLAVSAFATDLATGVGAITGSSVRIRSAASTSSTVVATLNKGTAVAIISGPTNNWYKISYAGKTGYVSKSYLVKDQDGIFTSYGCVSSSGVNVRSTASSSGSILATLSQGTSVKVTGYTGGWYSVTCTYGTKGYIRSDFINLTSSSVTTSSLGTQVISTAKQYLGTRYVYGGSSPSGFDCSGFTMYVYNKYGYSLPHTASGQWQSTAGTKIYSVSALKTGDLVFFCDPSRSNGKTCSHAGIYLGNGQFIHASSSKSGGVIISSLYENYYSGYFVGGKHIV